MGGRSLTRTQPFLPIEALRLADRPFLGVLDVVVITPHCDVIAFELQDALLLRRTDLATVGALEPIQSFGKHTVPTVRPSCDKAWRQIERLANSIPAEHNASRALIWKIPTISFWLSRD